jgi:glycosyltransferase involved in cell wall biosynthesis
MDISIVITAFNYAEYIENCVASCLSQHGVNVEYELIVVDDGSTDQTPFVLQQISDVRLRKFRIENSGIEAASNFGFREANGKYIVRVDADDLLLPGYLAEMQKYISATYDFIYSDYTVIDANGSLIDTVHLPDFDLAEIRARGDFLATGTLYSAKALRAIDYYSESIKNSGLENYELILKLLQSNSTGKHINKTIFSYRRHSSNISISRCEQIIQYGSAMFRRMNLGNYVTNKYHPYIPEIKSQ